jgi:peptidoglycan/xylan/chitin deacetylase (PgdA/CDA1 family)
VLPRDSVFLTFDDGLRDQAQITRNVLEPRGIRAAFFVCSRPALEGRALSVHKLHWLRAHTEPSAFAEELIRLLPGEWLPALDVHHNGQALDVYVYDPPEIARLKYALNFVLPPELIDDLTSQMLASRGIDERSFCEELYMDEAEIRSLAQAGHAIGVHGHSHRPLSRLGAELADDVRTNYEFIEKASGVRPVWISYPYGREDAIPSPDVLWHLFELFGFQLGLTLTGKWNQWPVDPRRLMRVNTNDVQEIISVVDAEEPA